MDLTLQLKMNCTTNIAITKAAANCDQCHPGLIINSEIINIIYDLKGVIFF